jgi:hypothetical protein
MTEFVRSNPGLESRFTRFIHFEDYSSHELLLILFGFCDAYQYRLSSKAQSAFEYLLEMIVHGRNERFGNARTIRNYFEKAISLHGERIARLDRASIDRNVLMTLELADVPFGMVPNVQQIDCPNCHRSGHFLLALKHCRCCHCDYAFPVGEDAEPLGRISFCPECGFTNNTLESFACGSYRHRSPRDPASESGQTIITCDRCSLDYPVDMNGEYVGQGSASIKCPGCHADIQITSERVNSWENEYDQLACPKCDSGYWPATCPNCKELCASDCDEPSFECKCGERFNLAWCPECGTLAVTPPKDHIVTCANCGSNFAVSGVGRVERCPKTGCVGTLVRDGREEFQNGSIYDSYRCLKCHKDVIRHEEYGLIESDRYELMLVEDGVHCPSQPDSGQHSFPASRALQSCPRDCDGELEPHPSKTSFLQFNRFKCETCGQEFIKVEGDEEEWLSVTKFLLKLIKVGAIPPLDDPRQQPWIECVAGLLTELPSDEYAHFCIGLTQLKRTQNAVKAVARSGAAQFSQDWCMRFVQQLTKPTP